MFLYSLTWYCIVKAQHYCKTIEWSSLEKWCCTILADLCNTDSEGSLSPTKDSWPRRDCDILQVLCCNYGGALGFWTEKVLEMEQTRSSGGEIGRDTGRYVWRNEGCRNSREFRWRDDYLWESASLQMHRRKLNPTVAKQSWSIGFFDNGADPVAPQSVWNTGLIRWINNNTTYSFLIFFLSPSPSFFLIFSPTGFKLYTSGLVIEL